VAIVKPSSRKRTLRRKAPASRAATPWTLRTSAKGVGVLQVPSFSKFPWLVHGFSTSLGGVSLLHRDKVLNLGFTAWDSHANVEKNRRLFQSAINAEEFTLVLLKQFHSDVISDFSSEPSHPCSADASITKAGNLLLGIQTADCVPVLLVDLANRSVAAVHAGWRGTLSRIAEKTVGRMEMQFGTRSGDLLAAIGPAIGGCCYEVGTEVAAAFLSQFAQSPEWFDELRTGDEPNPLQWLNQFPPGHQPPPKTVHLDLHKANRAQLLNAGIREENIFVSDLCTACRPDILFSYRKSGNESGRMIAAIGVREDGSN
jgi:polyphenol oxidase